jgi:hypothetical protein
MTEALVTRPVRFHRWGRAILWSGCSLSLLFALATLPGPLLRDPSVDFASRKGRLARVEIESETRHGDSTITELRLHSDSGFAVELAIRSPATATTALPTALLLGGKGTGRDAARLGADSDAIIVVALSYPYAGDVDVKGLRAVLQARRIRRALLDTVPAILLATEYLLEQPYVDPRRFDLVGVSLGAFLVSPAAVLDERIRRLWLVHGAGQPGEVIEYALREDIGMAPVRHMTAAWLDSLVGGEYLAPEHWVGRVSPRPVIVVNARNDESLPSASVEALHVALREPYEIVWTDGQHVQPNRKEVIEQLRKLVLGRMADEPR